MNAKTPKGRVVQVNEQRIGTASHAGSLYYGCVSVAYYCARGSSRCKTLPDALIAADEFIDECCLHE